MITAKRCQELIECWESDSTQHKNTRCPLCLADMFYTSISFSIGDSEGGKTPIQQAEITGFCTGGCAISVRGPVKTTPEPVASSRHIRKKKNVVTEKLLLVLHRGTVTSKPAGLFMNNHCLPVACSPPSWRRKGEEGSTSPDGLHALWESTCDVEDFFEKIGQTGGLQTFDGEPPNGLWVYEVNFDLSEVTDDCDEEWEWLCGGTFRRPTLSELEPLTVGKPPWNGILL